MDIDQLFNTAIKFHKEGIIDDRQYDAVMQFFHAVENTL